MNALFCVALALSTPGISAQKSATPAAIADATRICADALATGTVDATVIERNGWGAGKIEANGKRVSTPLKFYSRLKADVASASPIIMVVDDDRSRGVCTVTGRIASRSMREPVRAALTTQFPDTLVKRGEDYVFIRGRSLAVLSDTGAQDSPAVRVLVTTVSEGKK